MSGQHIFGNHKQNSTALITDNNLKHNRPDEKLGQNPSYWTSRNQKFIIFRQFTLLFLLFLHLQNISFNIHISKLSGL
jgi:hypothetical protein